jgi:uncharacterized repeat protein (TIGR01451 family)
VTVTDTPQTGLTITAMSGGGAWNCNVATATCSRSDALLPNASYPDITVIATVSAGAPPLLTNTASLTGGGDITPGNNTWPDQATITPAGTPVLSIVKNHTGNFTQGQMGATYTITVRNIGTAATNGTVSVADQPPSGLTITGMNGGGTWNCNVATATCTRSDPLSPNTNYPIITVTVNVSGSAPASLTNTATVSGGGAANAPSSDPTTIIPAPQSNTISVWSPSATPASPWVGDYSPVTLGMKFRSDVSGSITGIRFYKNSENTGSHIGLLYSSTGTLLAQATFTGETASGWQQVTFSSPVSISANTTYIAAYFTSTGYPADRNFFTSAGVDNPPLHALRSGVDGPNGLFVYAGAPQFPSQSSADSNYWVDVVLSPTSSATSVWSNSAVPATPWLADYTPVTLGMKFRSDVAGSVTGIRFYKGASNTGSHTGLLYSAAGALLAQGAFSGETASG